jgi:predicted NodU family carbamoyl transferase
LQILGISPGPHDAAAALVVDGQLRYLLEEERLGRTKRAPGEVPVHSALACLAAGETDLGEIDAVAVGWDLPAGYALDDQPVDLDQLRGWLLPVEVFGEAARTVPIVYVDHHRAHAASGYLTSPWDEAVIVVLDGRGEGASTSVFHGSGEQISLERSYDIPNSLGEFYAMASWWAGLDQYEPGKLMGLAPYGRPRFSFPITVTEDQLFDFAPLNPSRRSRLPGIEQQKFQYRHLFALFEEMYPFCRGDKLDIMAYADFAASVQAALEETVLTLCARWMEKFDCARVVLSGGVAMNCTLNGRLLAADDIDDVYIPPVPYDAGTALGAALVTSQSRAGEPAERSLLDHPYWQPPTPGEVPHADGCHLVVPPNEAALASYIARRLATGAIVGLWQENGEIGQRALGARSFLCDPRDRQALVRLNTLKGREMWRPVAPAVQAEYWDDFFAEPARSPATFMLAAYQVRGRAQPMIPSCVHVDGSARPQIVRQSPNPIYWQIIDAFRRLTGVPAVVNTSFNLAGEPIVHTMADAISTFVRSAADTLVVGPFILEKQQPPRPLGAAT